MTTDTATDPGRPSRRGEPPDPLSATFSALADPTRRAILARLAGGEASVTELARPFDISLPAVSRHLKVLERAGLIERRRDAQWRHCRIQPAALADVHRWVDGYRQLWEDRLDRLEDYLHGLQAADSQTTPEARPGEDRAR